MFHVPKKQEDNDTGFQKLVELVVSAALASFGTSYAGLTKAGAEAAAAPAAHKTSLQHAPCSQSVPEAKALPSTAADGAKAAGGAQLLPGCKRLRQLPGPLLQVSAKLYNPPVLQAYCGYEHFYHA